MKALTLHQPWATLMAIGVKSIETRSWTTPYRGLLAIHASSRYTMALAQQTQEYVERLKLWSDEESARVLAGNLRLELNPAYCRGRIVCIVRLVAIHPITVTYRLPDSPEYDFGDYSIGRYAWHTEHMYTFDKPIRAVGRQQLWDWEVPIEFAGAKWLDTADAAHDRSRGKRTGRSAVGRGS